MKNNAQGKNQSNFAHRAMGSELDVTAWRERAESHATDIYHSDSSHSTVVKSPANKMMGVTGS